jgi:hypothetical protein
MQNIFVPSWYQKSTIKPASMKIACRHLSRELLFNLKNQRSFLVLSFFKSFVKQTPRITQSVEIENFEFESKI